KLQIFLGQFAHGDVTLEGLTRRKGLVDPFDGRFAFSPAKLKSIYSRKEERGLIGTQIGVVRADLERLNKDITRSDIKLKEIHAALISGELDLMKTHEEFSGRRRDLEI